MNKLPNVELMRCEPAEPLQPTGLTVGSITFAPDRSKPCYDAAEVSAQAEVERLRTSNAKLIQENNELKRRIKILEAQ